MFPAEHGVPCAHEAFTHGLPACPPPSPQPEGSPDHRVCSALEWAGRTPQRCPPSVGAGGPGRWLPLQSAEAPADWHEDMKQGQPGEGQTSAPSELKSIHLLVCCFFFLISCFLATGTPGMFQL